VYNAHHLLYRLVMTSLKAVLPRLATMFDSNPDALYERQRALVRLGVLKPIQGRGPGSGVEFSANSVATLLIAVTAVNSLSEVDTRIAGFCNAMPHYPSETCPFTGQKTFLAALQAIFENARLASKVRNVSVEQNTSRILIAYTGRDGRKILKSLFKREGETIAKFITKTAVIERFVFQSVYQLVNEKSTNANLVARMKSRTETRNKKCILKMRASNR
jgi:hypothetical protein